MEYETWHENCRRFDDGVILFTRPLPQRPDLVSVRIMSMSGYEMYSGSMSVIDALTEIPFQLDRARAMDKELSKSAR